MMSKRNMLRIEQVIFRTTLDSGCMTMFELNYSLSGPKKEHSFKF